MVKTLADASDAVYCLARGRQLLASAGRGKTIWVYDSVQDLGGKNLEAGLGWEWLRMWQRWAGPFVISATSAKNMNTCSFHLFSLFCIRDTPVGGSSTFILTHMTLDFCNL